MRSRTIWALSVTNVQGHLSSNNYMVAAIEIPAASAPYFTPATSIARQPEFDSELLALLVLLSVLRAGMLTSCGASLSALFHTAHKIKV